MHVDLAWEVEDIQTFVARPEPRAVATWQTPLSLEWQGVEVLDVEEEWLPLESRSPRGMDTPMAQPHDRALVVGG